MKPHFLTLGQAVKHVQCSKATLSKALNKGDLSGSKQPDGSWRIDPAELTRWDSERSTRGQKIATQTPSETPVNTHETNALQAKIDALMAEKLERAEDRIAELVAERDEWREQARALRSITDQREQVANGPQKPRERGNGLFGWLRRAGA